MAIYVRGFVLLEDALLVNITRAILAYAAGQGLNEESKTLIFGKGNEFINAPIVPEGELIEGLGSSLAGSVELPEAFSFADSMKLGGYSHEVALWLTRLGDDEGLRLHELVAALSQDANSGLKGAAIEVLTLEFCDHGVMYPTSSTTIILDGNIRRARDISEYGEQNLLTALQAALAVSLPLHAVEGGS